jgi:hypothetical protein
LPVPDPAIPGFGFLIPVVDFANPPTPVMGLTIQVCQINDFNCNNPVPPELVQVRQPDPTRLYINLLNLPYGFDGYLRMNAPGYIQNEYYFLGPIVGDPDGETILADAIGMPRLTTVETFFESFGGGVQRDPTKGLIAMRIFDCGELQRRRAAGVRLEMLADSSTALGFTILNGQLASASTPPLETDARGVAGFANVTPAVVALEGVLSGNRRFGYAAVTVRANQLTQADLRPNYFFGR